MLWDWQFRNKNYLHWNILLDTHPMYLCDSNHKLEMHASYAAYTIWVDLPSRMHFHLSLFPSFSLCAIPIQAFKEFCTNYVDEGLFFPFWYEHIFEFKDFWRRCDTSCTIFLSIILCIKTTAFQKWVVSIFRWRKKSALNLILNGGMWSVPSSGRFIAGFHWLEQLDGL